MKICLISSSFYPAIKYGGPISATWDLSNKLTNHNFKVYVSTTNANISSRLNVLRNQYIKINKNLFIKYYHEELINRFSFNFLFKVWSDIKKSDIVYIQYLFHYTVIISLFYSILQKKRVIICARGSFSDYTFNHSLTFIKYVWIYLFIYPFSRYITWQACSYIEKKDILKIFPSAQIQIINDGIDYNAFQESKTIDTIKLVENLTSKRFDKIDTLFFSLGRLHKIKCFDVLIDAFHLYYKENQHAKLIIAGDDYGERDKLISQINNLGLSDSIFLIGHINFNTKKIIFNNSDFFVLASEFESFGIVVAEALACGLPVVISNKTPWSDIEENNCGILANNDQFNLYRAMQKISKINFNKQKIKDYVRNKYDWDEIVQQFICLINNK